MFSLKDPAGKDCNARFTTAPLKGFSAQEWIIYQSFCFLKLLIFIAVSMRKWLSCSLFIRGNGETRRNKHFLSFFNSEKRLFLPHFHSYLIADFRHCHSFLVQCTANQCSTHRNLSFSLIRFKGSPGNYVYNPFNHL